MKKARILYLEMSTAGTIGGSHHSLYFLIRELDQNRYEPIIGFYESNELESDFRELGARVEILSGPARFRGLAPFRGPLNVLNSLRRAFNSIGNFSVTVIATAMQRARWLRENRIDLVHFNNNPFSGDWILACRLLGIPCVAHLRGIRTRLDRLPIYLASRVDHVFCISQAVFDSLTGCGCKAANFSVLHNGIDPGKVQPDTPANVLRQELDVLDDTLLIGMVGNIKRWKGQKVLVEALPAVIKENPDIVCVFVGMVDDKGKPYYEEIKAFIADNNLERHAIFAGYSRNVANYLNAFELVVHASTNPEPFGRVIIEAMALEKPVIASRGGGVPEIVDESCGRMFTPGSSEELSMVINELLTDPQELISLGVAGRKRVDTHFNISTNARRTMEVYDRLLA